MDEETIVSSRPDREIKKKIIAPGDFNVVPYEDSRCKIVLSDVKCTNLAGNSDEIEPDSKIFSKHFDGNVLIGDSDCYIDRDFELILQQMCSGEICMANLLYRDSVGQLVKEMSFKIELKEVTEEQLLSDWSWQRLFEAATHHKERGVELVKQKKLTDAFKRFNKSLKMLVATEPIDPADIDSDTVKEMITLKVNLYNNLAHLQLKYNQFDEALVLCDRALKYDPENTKALYRRCLAYAGLKMYDEAWTDIQNVLRIKPNDKDAKEKAVHLKPMVDQINRNYTDVIKKMFK